MSIHVYMALLRPTLSLVPAWWRWCSWSTSVRVGPTSQSLTSCLWKFPQGMCATPLPSPLGIRNEQCHADKADLLPLSHLCQHGCRVLHGRRQGGGGRGGRLDGAQNQQGLAGVEEQLLLMLYVVLLWRERFWPRWRWRLVRGVGGCAPLRLLLRNTGEGEVSASAKTVTGTKGTPESGTVDRVASCRVWRGCMAPSIPITTSPSSMQEQQPQGYCDVWQRAWTGPRHEKIPRRMRGVEWRHPRTVITQVAHGRGTATLDHAGERFGMNRGQSQRPKVRERRDAG